MKRIVSLLLVIVMLFAFSGCSGEKKTEQLPAVTEAPVQAEENGLLKIAKWMQSEIPEPGFGSVGGEWLAMGLARSELEGMEEYLLGYGERVAAHLH